MHICSKLHGNNSELLIKLGTLATHKLIIWIWAMLLVFKMALKVFANLPMMLETVRKSFSNLRSLPKFLEECKKYSNLFTRNLRKGSGGDWKCLKISFYLLLSSEGSRWNLTMFFCIKFRNLLYVVVIYTRITSLHSCYTFPALINGGSRS